MKGASLPKFDLTRRAFVGVTAAAVLAGADDGWVTLFDGRSLEGWRPNENKASWKVVDGQIVADGPRSHLFYSGPVQGANFKNFELEVEALAKPQCNSGVYFHTAYQEKDYPYKGFEVQINNTATGEGGYLERKKTASLYGLRNIYKQFVPDDQWFKFHVAVRGKNVQIRLNGMLMVDYTEATPPVIPDGPETGRFLDRGTFALQCHNKGSVARFRSIRVRPLPDDTPTPGGATVAADAVYKEIVNNGRHNLPMVDYHVHLKEGLTLEQALDKSRRDGIEYGIAVNCGLTMTAQNDAQAQQFLDSMKGQPCFVAMQAEGREWTKMFSRPIASQFDYIFTDSMTWTDNRGKRMRLWIPDEVGTIADPQEFMDTLVDRAVGIFDHEPVDIYVNPTFLPAVLQKDYDTLWTEPRMRKIVDGLVRNHIAMELNNRYKLPSAAFVRMAKDAGVKFTFGTNNAGPGDLRRCEYGLAMVAECKLGWQNFFVPGAWWPKAIERRGDALKA
jgi:hypothetical protein